MLQEINPEGKVIIGGDTGDDIIQMVFRAELRSLKKIGSVGDTLTEMQRRVSANPMDKVAGLIYRLNPQYITIYDAKQSEESSWEDLVHAMDYLIRIRLFYCYPQPGEGNTYWGPSWTQVMNAKFVLLGDLEWPAEVYRTEETDADWHQGPCIDSASVQGLANSSNNTKRRQGKHRQCFISEWLELFLGGRTAKTDGMFEKLSVLEMANLDEAHKLYKLGIIQGPAKTFLR
ncbi:uncharacterized protein EV420DRAFT_1650621 [Desarmillaria tabescens]|uniref:Uncharacterized protein n=1 Tax=Armillaria tabescens TaxID=1929756 RepID=A0AA39MNM0_ARMTA|nr:uncharacterized protein EV420DRAFT_1650621 [Desarmillaria tabescens]KAK0440030.1 hypothetical protein EV420DRAFT_1650621 [Desarmillaria tabescens]